MIGRNEIKLLDRLELQDLKKYLRRRSEELRTRYGLWGESKKPVRCPYCKQEVGVRELRRHKKRLGSTCPARQLKRGAA